MITRVIRFQAKDGTEWTNLQDAKKREKLINDVNKIMKLIPKVNIKIGKEFYQHQPKDVLAVQSALAILAQTILGKGVKKDVDQILIATKPMGRYSWLGRYLSDTSEAAPIDRAWGRLSCIDEEFREWEQPYYTTHTPTDAIKLNP